MHDEDLRSVVRAEVHAYLSRMALRYVPVMAGVLALVLLVVLVPDVHQQNATNSLATTGSSTVPGVGQASPGGQGAAVAGASGSGGSGPGTTGGNVPSGSATSPSGTGPVGGSAGPASGVAASGVKCGPGIRQFTWAPYAPNCTPAWHGDNGGATAHGVTATTITLTMRNTTDSDGAFKGLGAANFATQAAAVQGMVNYFNTQFELYGRKVVLKTFNGRGSFLAEASGQDQAGASADAQTAYDMGAFASVSVTDPGGYMDAVNARHMLTLLGAGSIESFRANAPYRYGSPSGSAFDLAGSAYGALTCQRMNGMPAVFAGDAVYQRTTRKFAVLDYDAQPFAAAGDTYMAAAKSCRAPAEKINFKLDFASYPQQATQLVARLKADGVTTVNYAGDGVMFLSVLQAADAEQYHPEWVTGGIFDSNGRQSSADQMAHVIKLGPWRPTTTAPDQRLCHRIQKQAAPSAAPEDDFVGDTYCSALLAFYGALQQAGPSLTPATFQRGWFSVPPSAGSSDYGAWNHGPNYWSPDGTFNISWWNPSAHSAFDGGTGQFQPCEGGAEYPYDDPRLGTGQLHCFGK